MRSAPAPRVAVPSDDAELVQRALARDDTAFRTIMERYNRRLYRIARSILRNDSEAEDVVQEAYVNAFTHLEGFRGDSSLATWLSRITMNEALGRLRRERPSVGLETFERNEPRRRSFNSRKQLHRVIQKEQWRNEKFCSLSSERLTTCPRSFEPCLSRA